MKFKNLITISLAFLLILFSGCMTITINQEVKEDGSADIEMIMDLSKVIELAKSSGAQIGDLENMNFCENITSDMQGDNSDMEILDCQEKEGVITIKGKGDLKEYFSKEEKLLYTKYIYDLEASNFSGNLKDQFAQEGMSMISGFEMNYNLKMPGKIEDPGFGVLENNVLKIDLLEVQELKKVTSKAWNKKMLGLISLVLLFVLIAVAYTVFNKKSKKADKKISKEQNKEKTKNKTEKKTKSKSKKK